MSAIGGRVSYERGEPDTGLLMEMSGSMLPRGRDQRGAYIKEGVWLLHNRAMADGEAPFHRQPMTLQRGGFNYTVVLDGRLCGRGEWSGLGRDVSAESDAVFALECYLVYGTSFTRHICGSFALAIWDEKHGELILVTDGEGSRPLFYTIQGNDFVFASEIKGLLRAIPSGAAIDVDRLRAHLIAPPGTYGGADLYRDICALPGGHCAVLSRMGLTVFPYEIEERVGTEWERRIALPVEPAYPDGEELRQALTEALFAFDYPQFDAGMPALLRLMAQSRERRLTVEDDTLYAHIGYAKERADRLGQGKGKVLRVVAPDSVRVKERELKKMDRRMERLLREIDTSPLCRLYGADWREIPAKEKNTAKRIRMWGILYQSLLWERNYPIIVNGTR